METIKTEFYDSTLLEVWCVINDTMTEKCLFPDRTMFCREIKMACRKKLSGHFKG
jgi:hypothetical protein